MGEAKADQLAGLAIWSTVDKLQRLACDALVAESEILEIWETTQVQPRPKWEPHFARNYTIMGPGLIMKY